MKFSQSSIYKGFIIAGLMNLSVLLFSRMFTNEVIPAADPIVMSNFGLLMIVVWGLAYISVASSYDKVKWLVFVFAIEKLIYGIAWIRWLVNNNVSDVIEEDVMAGIFYSIYGINDLVFFGFFAYVYVLIYKQDVINAS